MKIYKPLIVALIIFASSVYARAQTEFDSTPTVWENYTASNATFLMPKLPVIITGGDACRGEAANKYAAFSGGAVYVVIETYKVKPNKYCEKPHKFDETNFYDRAKQLKIEMNSVIFIDEKADEIKLTKDDRTIKLVNDFKNKRWYELQVYGAHETEKPVTDFLNSLKLDGDDSAKQIGQGGLKNIGDEKDANAGSVTNPDEEKSADEKTKQSDKDKSLTLILKPKANYTDAARQKNVQGTVRLRVTFSANGGIGSIAVVSTLPYGLTEQATAAAGKIFFLPAKRGEKPISVTKLVEYSFSIY